MSVNLESIQSLDTKNVSAKFKKNGKILHSNALTNSASPKKRKDKFTLPKIEMNTDSVLSSFVSSPK